jgi:four helix bundle protein
MSDFRSLIVWQKAMDLTKQIYIVTKKIPDDERFGLIGQMRRCAVSIASNIAEGSKRGTKKDFSQFLRVSSGSAAELETQLLLSKDLYNIEVDKDMELLKEVQKMLESLAKKL